MIYSAVNIFTWKKENDEIDDLLNHLTDISNVVEKKDGELVEVIEPDDTVPPENPFWQYAEMDLLYVDFSELKQANSKTVGWIEVKGTNVNLPYVQTNDNKYYLTHSFDNSYNSCGWAFLDYRNNKNNSDKNTIIYAHGRKNGSMFGSLRNLLNKDWQSNKDNYVIRTSTETENTLWQIFSVYYLPTTNDYIQVKFKDDEEFETFANKILNRSMFDFKTNVSKNDKILTLSTCYSSTEKLVVHAKLIKKEAR
jgi:sortase B